MALVRQSACQSEGSFSHIPDAWEDFDFWCKLVEGDWDCVLCPQPLATYTLQTIRSSRAAPSATTANSSVCCTTAIRGCD